MADGVLVRRDVRVQARAPGCRGPSLLRRGRGGGAAEGGASVTVTEHFFPVLQAVARV